MPRNFYFGADATMVSGSAVFSAIINADAPVLGLTEQQALGFREIDLQLQAAYQTAIQPSTRMRVAVAHKDACMKAMQRRARFLSDMIRGQPTVTDAQLISLGLLPRSRRTRRQVPQAPPRV